MSEISADVTLSITISIPLSPEVIALWREWKGPEPILSDMVGNDLVIIFPPHQMLVAINYLNANGIKTVLK